MLQLFHDQARKLPLLKLNTVEVCYAWFSLLQNSMSVQYNTTQYSTEQYNWVQYCTTVKTESKFLTY
jgi:hypothetical protein